MRFEYYRALDRLRTRVRWYWRLRARNGKVVADGAEGYATASGVRRAVARVAAGLADADTLVRVDR